jgi:histidine triad (HIT) family protein
LPLQGHALLIPKAPGYATIYDMPPDVAANVLRELPRLAKAVQAATGCDGVNIVQNNGGAAGQVVFHAHFHVIPRNEGDGLVRLGSHGGASKMISPEDGNAIADAIRAAL